MSQTTNNETHISTVNNNIYLQDKAESDVRNLTHPRDNLPVTSLEDQRQQSSFNKFIELQESLATMARPSLPSETEQEGLSRIVDTIEHLNSTRTILLALKDSDIESATQIGRDLMITTTDLLVRVVKQIGQTNIQTPTFESILAYIRNLIHTKSANMRQTIPEQLLIDWYELSRLMLSMQNEPELRITIQKTRQLLDITHNTAAWAFQYLSNKHSNTEVIGFIDRNNTPYTYE